MVTVSGKHLDGVGVVGVGRFCFECAFKLAEVVINVVTVRHASDGKINDVELALVFGPHADVVAFVLDAEVL